MTKLTTLDVSKLPKLKSISANKNNIRNIKFKDSKQFNQIQFICIDHNHYS